jgi:hypothetical protein
MESWVEEDWAIRQLFYGQSGMIELFQPHYRHIL